MSRYENLLNKYYRPERFEEVERLHRCAFDWQPQGRIPLGIHVADPAHTRSLNYDRWLDPEPFLEAQLNFLADTLQVGSDLLPVVAINHTGTAPLTSMFGAEQFIPEQTSATVHDHSYCVWDIGPTPLPVFAQIEEVAELEVPPISAGIQPDIERMGRYYRENLPPWVRIVGPMPEGTFSSAVELRGSDFFLDLVDQPELCKHLMMVCAELQCRLTQRFFELVDPRPRDRHLTNFAISSPSVRLGDDSICNLSKQMIQEFCPSGYEHVNKVCGGVGHIHFCSLAHSRFEQIYEATLEMPEVRIISSQFAFEYYQQHLEAMRGKLAVETFYGGAYAYVCQKYGSFQEWTNEFVPRYKNESGLVMYMQVDSVEEGQEVWARWTEAHALRD